MKRRRDGVACRRWAPLAAATALAANVTATLGSTTHYGTGTVASIPDIARAGCNFVSWPRMAESEYAALLGSAQASDATTAATPFASACGRCARVWCDDERLCRDPEPTARGVPNSAVVYIVEDQRTRWNTPVTSGNTYNADLNLSPRVFQNLTGTDTGRVAVRWRFVDCPSFPTYDLDVSPDVLTPSTSTTDDDAGCAVCVRKDSSAYYLSLQPVNDTLGVATLEVSGARTTRPSGSMTFFFNIADSQGRLDLSRLEISLTTRSQRRFTRIISVKPGGCVAMRRTDEVPVDGGASPSGGNPSASSKADENDEGEGDEPGVLATLPPSLAPVTPRRNNGSFVVVPTLPPATNGPSASRTIVPSPAGSPLVRPTKPPVSPVVGPAPSQVSPSVAIHHPSSAPFASAPSPSPPSPPAAASPAAPAAPQPASPSDVQVVATVSPTPIDKDGAWSPQDPSGSDARPRTPRLGAPTPTMAAPSSPSDGSAAAPQPSNNGGHSPTRNLAGGVLTNPVFVGVLLGTVGLVGAVVAYRAKSRQRARLALVPPPTTTTPRTEFGTL